MHQTKIKRKKKKPQVHQDKRVEPKMNTPIFATQNKQESNTHTGRVKKQKRKKKKRQQKEETTTDETNKKPLTPKQRKNKELNEKLLKTLQTPPETKKHQKSRDLSLRERMMQRLQAARFRYINEQIYSNDSKEAQKLFKDDPDAFTAYHEGYRQQVNKWPLNPLDEIIKNIQQLCVHVTYFRILTYRYFSDLKHSSLLISVAATRNWRSRLYKKSTLLIWLLLIMTSYRVTWHTYLYNLQVSTWPCFVYL